MNLDERTNSEFSMFRDLLSGGDRRSLGRSPRVIDLVEADPSRIALVVELLTDEDPLIRMRAADVVEKLSRSKPEMLRGSQRYLLEKVGIINQQEVRWHIAQILPRLSLSASGRQRAIGLLKSYLSDERRIVRVCALQGLADFAERDHKLVPAVVRQIEAAMKNGSPAIRARGRHLLNQLTKTAGKRKVPRPQMTSR